MRVVMAMVVAGVIVTRVLLRRHGVLLAACSCAVGRAHAGSSQC